MKKIISIVLIFSLLIMSSIYVTSEQQIKNIVVVSGIGIDYDKKTDSYILTVEVLNINQITGENSEPGNLTKTMQYKGKTVSSAAEKMAIELGKTVVYSQKKAIILGKSVFEKGYMNVVDFFIRDYKTRSGVLAAVAKDCTAEEIIKVNEGKAPFPSQELQIILKSGKDNGYTTEMDMAQLTNMYLDKCSAAYIPTLSIKTQGEDKYTYLTGFAVINNDNYVGDLNLTEGRGLLFVNDKFDRGTISIENEQLGILTFKIVQSTTDVSAYISKETKEPKFDIKVKLTADLVEQEDANKLGFTKERVKKLEEVGSLSVKNTINKTISKCLTEYESDVFSLGRRIYIKYPKYFKEHEDYFPGKISPENVNVEVDFNLRRVGQGNI